MEDGKLKADNGKRKMGDVLGISNPTSLHLTSFSASRHLFQHIPHFVWNCF
jgi:hypothetical protein